MARSLATTFFLFLSLLVVVSHAATTPQEEYWHAVLPNTPIPNAIRAILNTGVKQNFHIDKGEYGIPLLEDNSGYTGINTNYGGTADERVDYDQSITYFFKEEDLFRPGAKMNFPFPRNSFGRTFLSRQAAESIPFSSSRLPDIFSRFSIDPKSESAKYVINTLTKCELPAEVGETKLCATSLESMVDFSTSILGTNQLQAVSTVAISKDDKKQPEVFSVKSTRRLNGDKLISCHAEPYPYAVFYCHATPARGYVTELVGEKGMRVAAAVTCHTDTKAWSPDHLAFKILKVKPGEATICHFLPQFDLIWTRSIN